MEIVAQKNSLKLYFMKTNENNQIIGHYNKANLTYTGQLDGWKVTRGLVGAIATVGGLIASAVGFSIFGCLFFGSASLKATMMITSMPVAGAIAGSGLVSLILGIIAFPKHPKPSPLQFSHEKELKEAEQLKRDQAKAAHIRKLLALPTV